MFHVKHAGLVSKYRNPRRFAARTASSGTEKGLSGQNLIF
jgi:hypothetical protein